MDYDLKYISWDEAKKSDKYFYTGNINTANEIANIFQILATNKFNEKRRVVRLKYYDYICDLDIFWEEIGIEDEILELAIELFVEHQENTINNSERLSISDIYKYNYLENKMYEFILESI